MRWTPRSLFPSLYADILGLGVGRLPPAVPRNAFVVIGKELCYCCYCRLLTHRPEVFAAELVGVLLGVGHPAVLMGLLLGALWSLDILPATACLLDGSLGGTFHAIKLIARQVRVMS